YRPAVPSHDPNYGGIPSGGNVGIIKDPLGLHGGPQLVAVTRPIPLGAVHDVALSPDGKLLYASSGTNSVFVFNVEEMLKAVENPQFASQLKKVPVDELQVTRDPVTGADLTSTLDPVTGANLTPAEIA